MKRRKARRVECVVPVEGKEGSLFDQTRVIDFSKEGVGFVSDHKIPVNQEIAIELDLEEGEEPALVVGKVKWVTSISGSGKFRIGLIFDDVLRGSKTRLKKYFQKESKNG